MLRYCVDLVCDAHSCSKNAKSEVKYQHDEIYRSYNNGQFYRYSFYLHIYSTNIHVNANT